jgi:hypothetical protein
MSIVRFKGLFLSLALVMALSLGPCTQAWAKNVSHAGSASQVRLAGDEGQVGEQDGKNQEGQQEQVEGQNEQGQNGEIGEAKNTQEGPDEQNGTDNDRAEDVLADSASPDSF